MAQETRRRLLAFFLSFSLCHLSCCSYCLIAIVIIITCIVATIIVVVVCYCYSVVQLS